MEKRLLSGGILPFLNKQEGFADKEFYECLRSYLSTYGHAWQWVEGLLVSCLYCNLTLEECLKTSMFAHVMDSKATLDLHCK